MIYRVLPLAALFAMWACSNDNSAGGNSTETENAIAFRVLDVQGEPLANVSYRILPADFVADTSQRLDSGAYAYSGESDASGMIRIEDFQSSDYLIEFENDSLSSVLRYSVDDSLDDVTLQKPGSVGGVVELPENADFAWVFFYGLDRAIKTDSAGRFFVENVPSGNLTIAAALPNSLETIKEIAVDVLPADTLNLDWKYSKSLRVKDYVSDWMLPLQVPTVLTIRLDSSDLDFAESNHAGDDLRLVDSAGALLPMRIAYWDSAYGMGVLQVRINDLSDTLSEWTLKWGNRLALPQNAENVWENISDSLLLAMNSVLVADFENNSSRNALPSPIAANSWYKSASENGSITPSKEGHFVDALAPADSGRSGTAAHFVYTGNDPDYALVATNLSSGKRNLAQMDSVELWIRGDGDYSIALENLEDSDDMKALYRGSCTSGWSRVVVRPQDFLSADSVGGNYGWDYVKYGITTMTIFARNGHDLWLDDIRIYGINIDDLK